MKVSWTSIAVVVLMLWAPATLADTQSAQHAENEQSAQKRHNAMRSQNQQNEQIFGLPLALAAVGNLLHRVNSPVRINTQVVNEKPASVPSPPQSSAPAPSAQQQQQQQDGNAGASTSSDGMASLPTASDDTQQPAQDMQPDMTAQTGTTWVQASSGKGAVGGAAVGQMVQGTQYVSGGTVMQQVPQHQYIPAGTVIPGNVVQGTYVQGPTMQYVQGPVMQGPVMQGTYVQGSVLQGTVPGTIVQGDVMQGTTLPSTIVTQTIQQQPSNVVNQTISVINQTDSSYGSTITRLVTVPLPAQQQQQVWVGSNTAQVQVPQMQAYYPSQTWTASSSGPRVIVIPINQSDSSVGPVSIYQTGGKPAPTLSGSVIVSGGMGQMQGGLGLGKGYGMGMGQVVDLGQAGGLMDDAGSSGTTTTTTTTTTSSSSGSMTHQGSAQQLPAAAAGVDPTMGTVITTGADASQMIQPGAAAAAGHPQQMRAAPMPHHPTRYAAAHPTRARVILQPGVPQSYAANTMNNLVLNGGSGSSSGSRSSSGSGMPATARPVGGGAAADQTGGHLTGPQVDSRRRTAAAAAAGR